MTAQLITQMQPSLRARKVREMFGSIAGRYDVVNTVLSFGIHFYWRWMLFSEIKRTLPVEKRTRALDICTGTGALIPKLSEIFHKVWGVDFCTHMLKLGKERLKSVSFIQADALELSFVDRSFDAVTVAYGVRNFVDVAAGIREIKRVLKPGGAVFILDFGQPKNRLVKIIYDFYSRHILPKVGAAITGNAEAYTYLPQTARSFPCGPDFCRLLNEHGFSNVRFKELSFGVAYLYMAEKACY